MPTDENWEMIESTLEAPMITVNWAAQGDDVRDATRCGMVDWWRKMPDVVRRRRSKEFSTSEMHHACDICLYFLKYYAGKSAHPRFFAERETWSHNVLSDFAEWQRSKTGTEEINTLAQAVMRDAMHELERTERRGL